MAWLLNRGTRTSARVDTVLTVVKILVVLLVVVVGLTKVDSGSLDPFAPFGFGGAATVVLVCLAVLVLRHRRPDLPRGSRCSVSGSRCG